MTGRERFATIDALRGVAAIAVMLFHAFPSGSWATTGGYLAVDLFFMMSGFVIALSFEDRLRAGLALRRFMASRAIRLWPMLAMGATLGIALHGGHAGMLFLLPNPYSSSLLFPANPPLWSLLFEALAYFAFAVAGARAPTSGLVIVIILSGAMMAVFALIGPAKLVDFGADWRTLLPGTARLAFSYCLGILIFRLRRMRGLRTIVTPFAWLLPLLLCLPMLVVPWRGDEATLLGLATITIVFPAILWWASCWQPPASTLAEGLGDLSYPLYCIHVPIIALVPEGSTLRWPLCALLVLASVALDRAYDRPVRRWLQESVLVRTDQTRIGIRT